MASLILGMPKRPWKIKFRPESGLAQVPRLQLKTKVTASNWGFGFIGARRGVATAIEIIGCTPINDRITITASSVVAAAASNPPEKGRLRCVAETRVRNPT